MSASIAIVRNFKISAPRYAGNSIAAGFDLERNAISRSRKNHPEDGSLRIEDRYEEITISTGRFLRYVRAAVILGAIRLDLILADVSPRPLVPFIVEQVSVQSVFERKVAIDLDCPAMKGTDLIGAVNRWGLRRDLRDARQQEEEYCRNQFWFHWLHTARTFKYRKFPQASSRTPRALLLKLNLRNRQNLRIHSGP
jgi:hypothetical protein